MSEAKPTRWVAPTPTLGQMLFAALGRSFVTAAVLSLVFFGIKFTYILFHPPAFIGLLFGQAGMAFAVVGALSFPIYLIASSRAWSDRVFTVSGFVATFFGLAILAVFFVQLADEVALWYHFTPILVEQENRVHRKKIDSVKEQTKVIEEKLAERLKERDEFLRQATTEAEKKEIRELFDGDIAGFRKELEKQAAEDQLIAERRLRPDTSFFAIVAYFLASAPDKDAQDSGIGPALWGSVWLGLITIVFAVPIGVGAALYLEEYRQEGWLAKVIQVNINNLAGVPSVVYGILGGFVFVYFFKKINAYDPDVDPFNLLGGGLTLGLLTLPMIIVSAQEAIRAVPSSLRQGAYALGATKWQVMWTIVLPMARPGILTGTILSLSRAIGEAAPLVLFGAQQYIDRNPSLFKPFTALPLQIFQWCGEPGITVEGYAESIDIWKYNAAVASSVLLMVLLGMNAVAIVLRNRAQRKMRY